MCGEEATFMLNQAFKNEMGIGRAEVLSDAHVAVLEDLSAEEVAAVARIRAQLGTGGSEDRDTDGVGIFYY